MSGLQKQSGNQIVLPPNGYATLIRFPTPVTGDLTVNIPAIGPNAYMSLTYAPINLLTTPTTLIVASRR